MEGKAEDKERDELERCFDYVGTGSKVNWEGHSRGTMTLLGKMQLLALAALPQLVFHDLLRSKANRHWTTPTLRQVMRCLVKWNNQRQTLQSDPVWPKTMHFSKDTKNTAIRFLVACEAVALLRLICTFINFSVLFCMFWTFGAFL